MAKKSAKTPSASGSRSPPPSRPETPASHESDEFSPMTRPSRGSTRKRTSFVWNHMTKDDKVTRCKHCNKTWFNKNVQSSTSNFRKHMIIQHHDKLSDADRENMTTGGQPSDKKTPQRALIKKYFDNAPAIPRSRSKSPDRLLTKFIINSSSSMRIVDDTDLGNFLKSLNSKYRLPSRGYLETNVLEPMYQETKQVVN